MGVGERGHDRAVEILKRYGFADAQEAFEQPDFDFFCPLGNGKIVGVSDKEPADKSLPESILPTGTDQRSTDDQSLNVSDEARELEFGDLEDLLVHEARGHEAPLKGEPSRWLDVVHANGKRESYDKGSVIRCALTPKYARKSLERQLRAAGISRDRLWQKDSKFMVSGEVTDRTESLVTTRDIGVTLVRCGEKVALAVIQATALQEDGKRVNSILLDSLGKLGKAIVVTAQMLQLLPISCLLPSTPELSESVVLDSDDTAPSLPGIDWVWSTDYMRVQLQKRTNSAPENVAQYQLCVPGWLFLPIAPNPVKLDHLQGVKLSTNCERIAEKPPSSTWGFTQASLDDLTESLWACAQDFAESLSDVMEEIPAVPEGRMFPYRDHEGALTSIFCTAASSRY